MPSQTYEDLVDLDHLALYHDKAKQLFATKEEVASGAGNVIDGITVGGTAVAPDANKVVALGSAAGASAESTLTNGANLPTGSAVKAYVEGKGYQTASDVASALATYGSLKKQVAQAVPTAQAADPNTLYYVMNSATGYYDIWQLVGSSVVRLDDVSVDLSGYVRSSDVTIVTNAQIDALFA